MALHKTMVETIARGMRACGCPDAAEQHLIARLEVHWDRLEEMGIACDEIENECHAFTVAWASFQNFLKEPGVG